MRSSRIYSWQFVLAASVHGMCAMYMTCTCMGREWLRTCTAPCMNMMFCYSCLSACPCVGLLHCGFLLGRSNLWLVDCLAALYWWGLRDFSPVYSRVPLLRCLRECAHSSLQQSFLVCTRYVLSKQVEGEARLERLKISVMDDLAARLPSLYKERVDIALHWRTA